MSAEEFLKRISADWPPCVRILGGAAEAYDPERRELAMTYAPTHDHCNSGDVVQGGFITAMLDATMAYAVLEADEGLATLEIKVSFIAVGRPGPMRCVGRPVNMGRSICFLEGELYQDDRLIATATTTGKLIRAKPDA